MPYPTAMTGCPIVHYVTPASKQSYAPGRQSSGGPASRDSEEGNLLQAVG